MIEEMAALLDSRAASLLASKRFIEGYEAGNCALAIRRAA